MASRVGIAVMGLGRMGTANVKNMMVSPRASIRWIVRNNLPEARAFVENFGLTARCTTPAQLDAVFNDPEVNAILICSPTDTHEALITQSLNAGKAIFCEKPVTPDIVTTKACYELAEKKKLTLFCAFHRRFDPSFCRMFDGIQSKTFGRLRILKVTSRDPQPPPLSYIRVSGGIFSDSTIHDLHMSGWMMGAKPRTVYAQGNAFDPDVDSCGDLDHVIVVIKYDGGAMSVIDNGRQANFGYDQRVEALCDHGMYTVDNRPSHQVTEHGQTVTNSPRIDDHWLTRYDGAYRNELEHFLDVMQGKDELRVTKEDTLTAMRLVEACRESIQSKSPVSI